MRAYRELDDALGLTAMAGGLLADARTGKNGRHDLIGMLRQSVLGRLAGYEDVNDAERLRHDPAMRWIVGGKARRAVRLRRATVQGQATGGLHPNAKENGHITLLNWAPGMAPAVGTAPRYCGKPGKVNIHTKSGSRIKCRKVDAGSAATCQSTPGLGP